MDAVRRGWRVARLLVFNRPLVPVILGLFYALGVFLLSIGVASGKDTARFALAIIFSVPAVGLSALAAERIALLCSSAGELKLPRHVEAVQSAQLLLLAFLIGVPIALLAAFGVKDYLALTAMLTASVALGVSLVHSRFVLVIPVFAFVLVKTLDDVWAWFLSPYVHFVVLLGAVFILYRWFALVPRQETHGVNRSGAPDAAHESSTESIAEAFGVGKDDVERFELAEMETVSQSTRFANGLPRQPALALGLGFEARPSAYGLARGIGLGLLALLVWHFLHGKRAVEGAYWVTMGFVILSMSTRFSGLLGAWCRTADEQALLKLTTRWPAESHIKVLFLQSMLWIVGAGWLAAGALTLVAWFLGSITSWWISAAAVTMLAASIGWISELSLLLTRRTLKLRRLWTLLVFASVSVGAILFLVELSPYSFVPILAPAAVAFVSMTTRPLQFPVIRGE